MRWTLFWYIVFLRFCPCNWGTPEARGYCSQSERLLFGRDTRNLRGRFRRFVGRNRKSRRREAAGRRNYPEAVPNGRGGNGDDEAKTHRITSGKKRSHRRGPTTDTSMRRA